MGREEIREMQNDKKHEEKGVGKKKRNKVERIRMR